jgi:hypothetical protein
MMHNKIFRFSALTVALAYIALSLIVLALFATPILYAWHDIVEERSTERLRQDSQRLNNVFKRHGANALKAVIGAMVEDQPPGDEKFILLADPLYSPVVGNLPTWPANIPNESGTYPISFQLQGATIDATFIRAKLDGDYNLIVGRNNAKFQTAEKLFWVGLIGATGIVILFGLLGRWLIRGALLAEVSRISNTTSGIVSGDLSRRLTKNGETNELDLLADTVNRMLDQIEQLIYGIRNISNAIAHDLRTPLTELRFRLESLILARPPEEVVFSEIDAAILDVDRVISIFNALLRLAEIDQGARRSGFDKVNMTRLCDDVVDFYQPLAEIKGIALTFDSNSEYWATGDSLLLAQALGNLIDNALKFAQSKVHVEVNRIKKIQDQLQIAIIVSDDGLGISDEEKPKVTERFYRCDVSRGTEGVGLGLSLVVAVAKLHGGSFKLSDAHPGLKASFFILSPDAQSDLP